MALLHCTSPGVPDIYQGTELLDLSLVDPDNRRPVDYARRRDTLRALEELALASVPSRANELRAMLEAPYDGRLKLWVIWHALRLRRTHPELFARGDYVAAAVTGERSRHVVAFARRDGNCGTRRALRTAICFAGPRGRRGSGRRQRLARHPGRVAVCSARGRADQPTHRRGYRCSAQPDSRSPRRSSCYRSPFLSTGIWPPEDS